MSRYLFIAAIMMRTALCFVPHRARPQARLFSTTTTDLSFETTPLGKNGKDLLKGLDLYTVPAHGDDHPLAVYGINSKDSDNESRLPVLLLHGRTWSAVPVYHLLPNHNNNDSDDSNESRSLMQTLYKHGLQPYTMDFRGFGGTHADATGYVEPLRCVQDTETVLEWIKGRHNCHGSSTNINNPALLGWSQGALIAQLLAQKPPQAGLISKLILYGSIYDPLVRYPREPLYVTNKPNSTRIANTFDDAIEDFTIEGTIPPEPACEFAKAALISDPVKAVWKHTFQFNNCDPARLQLPTMVIAGDQDPYAPLHVQQELFTGLGRGSDRIWSILSGSDHAVHMLEGRDRFVNCIVSFLKSS